MSDTKPRITVYMSEELIERIRQMAKEEHRSVSQQVIHLIQTYLKELDNA